MQIELEGSGYGSDLETSKEALDLHRQIHREIMDYKREIDRCAADKVSISGPF